MTKEEPSRTILKPLENSKIISTGKDFGITNSMVASYMICKEEISGDISCILPTEKEEISFNIENYSSNSEVFDEYLSKIF